jgi:hypothetical protein
MVQELGGRLEIYEQHIEDLRKRNLELLNLQDPALNDSRFLDESLLDASHATPRGRVSPSATEALLFSPARAQTDADLLSPVTPRSRLMSAMSADGKTPPPFLSPSMRSATMANLSSARRNSASSVQSVTKTQLESPGGIGNDIDEPMSEVDSFLRKELPSELYEHSNLAENWTAFVRRLRRERKEKHGACLWLCNATD